MKEPCGCCAGIEVVTPEPEANRPGLPALSYRAGTHESFMETMLARLTSLYIDIPATDGSGKIARIRPLSSLTTREPDDSSIALLDAWATVADVLTFYQERIANEGYLRTATERESILELAKLIGYRLRPAVSASVYLAFTVNDGFQGQIPAGTRAQSTPINSGDKPQFFETSDNLPARDLWNNLKPRLTRPQTITIGTNNPGTDADTRDTIYLQGISANLNVGDALLFVLGNQAAHQVLRKVEAVETQPDQNRTAITLEEKPFALGSSTTDRAAEDALLPYIEEAGTIFVDNDLAAEAAKGLAALLTNIKQAASQVTAAQMVSGFIADVENLRITAGRRRFTRVKAWLNDLKETLEELAPALAQSTQLAATGSEPPGGTVSFVPGAVQLLQSGLSSSPLENLSTIMGNLSKPASLQPANEWQLSRSVSQIFAPQADVAPRILAAFRPTISKTVYPAWTGVATPVSEVQVFAMRAKAAPFGNSAPFKVTVSDGNPTFHEWMVYEQNAAGGGQIDHEGDNVIVLDSANDKIRPGSWLVIDTSAVTLTKVVAQPGLLYAKAGALTAAISRADYGMSGKATSIPLVSPLDNSTAVNWLDHSQADRLETTSHDFRAIRGTVVYAQPEELVLAEEPLDNDIEGDKIELAQLYDGLEAGRWIIVSGERTDIPNTSGVTASELVMVSGIVQGAHPLLCVPFPLNFIPFSQWAYTTDANQYGDRLVVGYITPANLKAVLKAIADILDPQTGTAGGSTLSVNRNRPTFNRQFCDQVQLAPGVYANAYLPSFRELLGSFPDFNGLLVDPATNLPYEGGQISKQTTPDGLQVFAWRVSVQDVHTILTLANPLAYKYDPETITIYGNVVKATHGQTTGEVLGNGDASQSLQQFGLHQVPLTYLSAATPAGAQSTLTVRVNEVEWHEADNLSILGPKDREYVTDIDDTDHVTVTFGNGEHGMRVSTGVANVKAVYRYGCGSVGNVQEKQISQLASQPLGTKSVINPLRSSGGADEDTRDQARRNAPLAVMALDRLVSVRDYADFSRTYAGIGKAAAARLSDGHTLLVHVTIAGKDDIPIDGNSDLYRNLVQTLEQFGDPYQPLRVAVRRLKLLVIHAGIRVLPDYLWEVVGPNIKAALLDFYSFDRRELGQSAFMSEAIAVMQAVAGVQYVDLRVFDSALKAREFVTAELATPDPTATDPAKYILPAEIVTLTPAVADTLTLTEITV